LVTMLAMAEPMFPVPMMLTCAMACSLKSFSCGYN
jgi:hypothetical protein